MYVCGPRTRATSLSPRPIRGLSWLLNGPARRDVGATRGSSTVEFFDGFPVIEIRGEVAIIVLEQALCNQQLIRAPKTPCFPAPAFFRNPEVTLNRFRFSMNGIKPAELLKRLDAIHGKAKTVQSYLWVTEKRRCWETRGLRRPDQLLIAQGLFEDDDRDFTAYLNNWEPVKELNR